MYSQPHILTLVKKLITKILHLKLLMLLNWPEEVFIIKKFKDIVWTYVISDLNVEEIVGTAKKNCTKNIKNILEFKKLIKRKGNKLYAKWKGYNNSFNIWIVKKDILQMIGYFPQPKSSGGRVKVELDLPNYAPKADLKNAGGVNTSDSDLPNLKPDVVRLDTDKLKYITSNLSNLESEGEKLDVDKFVPLKLVISSGIFQNYLVFIPAKKYIK